MLFCQKTAVRSLMMGIAAVVGLLFVPSDFYGFVPSATSEFSPSPDPLWVQGKVLCEAGEYTKSLRFLTDLLVHTEKEGERGIILFWMGKAWEGTGDFDRAQDSYTAALRENPGLPELSRILAVHQGKATPLWDHAPSPKEPLSLPKASKPPYSEYSVVQPPVLPPPVVQMPVSPSSPLPLSYAPAPPAGTPPEWIPAPLPVQKAPQPVYLPPPFPREEETEEALPPPRNISPPFSPLPEVFHTGNRQPLSGEFQRPKGDMPSPAPVYVPPPPEGFPLLSEDISPAPEMGQEKVPEKPIYLPPPPSKEEEM